METAHEVAQVPARVSSALADGRRRLIDGPDVAGGDVESLRGHAPARLDARVVPARAGRADPRAPAVVADLADRVEVRPERADPPRLVRAEVRLVRGERRDRDVVLRALRLVRGELRREAQPVRRRVE